MNALTCIAPGKLAYQEIKKTIAILRVIPFSKLNGSGFAEPICMHSKETQPYFNYPRILGHELAGEIVETDNAGFHKEELVTIIPYFQIVVTALPAEQENPIAVFLCRFSEFILTEA